MYLSPRIRGVAGLIQRLGYSVIDDGTCKPATERECDVPYLVVQVEFPNMMFQRAWQLRHGLFDAGHKDVVVEISYSTIDNVATLIVFPEGLASCKPSDTVTEGGQ